MTIIYRVFHEESESELKKYQILQRYAVVLENGHKKRNQISGLLLLVVVLFVFLNCIPLKDLVIFELRFGFLMKNCIYGRLETSGDPNLNQKVRKLHVQKIIIIGSWG